MFPDFLSDRYKIPLQSKHKKLLRELAITGTHPSTLLHDFQAMLDVIAETEPKLTPKQQLKSATVQEINERLKNPLDVRLKRTTQTSYPPVEGLFLLLRASGLTVVRYKGKSPVLRIDKHWIDQWDKLNPTEKYCYLLEVWIMRGDEEILGGRSSSMFGSRTLEKILTGFGKIPAKGFKVESYKHLKQNFDYFPYLYNLALMDLFGMVKIHHGQPVDGEGWQVDKIERTQLGEALLAVLYDVMNVKIPERLEQIMGDVEPEDISEDQANALSEQIFAFSVFQPHLKDYFPAWQAVMQPPSRQAKTGHLTFKVSLGKIWSAKITIDTGQTFDALAHAILRAVKFDNDHLYVFVYKSKFGTTAEITHPYAADGMQPTNLVKLGQIGLEPGIRMQFIFDFGDWWEFDLSIEAHDPNATSMKVEVFDIKGEPPEQYPDWDESWDGDDYDDDDLIIFPGVDSGE